MWITFVYVPAQLRGAVHFGAPLGKRAVPPTGLWFNEHKQVRRAVAPLRISIFGDLPGLRRQRRARLFEPLLVRPVEVHLRTFRVVWHGIPVKDVFQGRDARAAARQDTPLLFIAVCSCAWLWQIARNCKPL